MHTALGLLVMLLIHRTKCVEGDCAVGEYLKRKRCTSCFEKITFGRTPCRHLCTNGYPVRKCVSACGFYCINEWCQSDADRCIQGCAKGWYGQSCDRRCAKGCRDNKCDRDGNCTCKIGWYGYQCNMQCPQNCSEEGCDFHKGKCTHGCKTHLYGDRCDKQCSPNCKMSECDYRNGRCTYGCKSSWYGDSCDRCKPGYRGSSCDTPCPPNCVVCDQHIPDKCLNCTQGRYGSVCVKTCKNCMSDMCDMDGNCTLGCQINYYGPKCKVCRDTCLVNTSSASTCFKSNGTCKYGCKHGWFGEQCEFRCNSRCRGAGTKGRLNTSHGLHCDDTCNTGWRGEICDAVTGACTEGCYNTTYGLYCNNTCSVGCKEDVCNQTTGVCTEGCYDRYYGLYCNNTCSVGCKGDVCNQTTGACSKGCNATFYGLHCNNTCSSNCSDSDCQMSVSGNMICSHGCIDGWWGSYCQHQCAENCQTCVNESGMCDETTNKTYNTSHSQICNEGCVDQECDTTGVCRHGCVHGWVGEKCQFSTVSVILSGCIIAVLATVGVLTFLHRRKLFKDGCIKPENADQGFIDIATMHALADSMPLLNIETYANKSSVTTRVPLGQFQKYVNRQKITSGLIKQFRRLPVNPVYPCYEGDLPQSALKNRYGNILPYDHNRVVLVKDCVGLSSDYINASFIEGYDRGSSFIATQGPFSDVMTAFWQMSWQKDVRQIVMLTNCVENGRKKCEQYWPDLRQTQMITPNITVECLNERVEDDITTRTFSLTKEGHMSRELTQFHFTTWPDNDVPDNVTSLLKLHTAVTTSAPSPVGPVLVHCSAGVGRTGTYIALDNLIQQAKAEGIVDVFECVLRLRHQRLNMVHTEEQYVLIHDVLLHAIDSIKDPICSVTVDVHT